MPSHCTIASGSSLRHLPSPVGLASILSYGIPTPSNLPTVDNGTRNPPPSTDPALYHDAALATSIEELLNACPAGYHSELGQCLYDVQVLAEKVFSVENSLHELQHLKAKGQLSPLLHSKVSSLPVTKDGHQGRDGHGDGDAMVRAAIKNLESLNKQALQDEHDMLIPVKRDELAALLKLCTPEALLGRYQPRVVDAYNAEVQKFKVAVFECNEDQVCAEIQSCSP
jgi:hypothetical protein